MANKPMFSEEEKEKAHKETLKMAEDEAKQDEDYAERIKENRKNASVLTGPKMYSDKDLASAEKNSAESKSNLDTLNRYSEYR